MFGRRILGGPPDGFKLLLGYQVANALSPTANYAAGQRWFTPDQAAEEHARALQHPETDFDPETGAIELHSALSSLDQATFETAQVVWTSGEADAVVLTRLKNASVIHGFHEEKVVLHMAVTRADTPGGTVSAANFDGHEEEVQVKLAVELLPPKVRRIELSRIGASGSVDPSLILQLLLECELEGVTRLRCCEGMLPAWDSALFRKLEGLRILNLSSCQLSSLPPGIGALTNLRELRVSGNKLSSLSAEVGSLRKLHRFIADNNLLTSIPGEIKRCSQLRELSLEANRLSAPVIDLRSLAQLRSLQLFGNPLDFLPELTPCSSLRHLSLANVRIRADPSFTKWDVEIAAPPTFSRTHKLAPLFGIIFRRSSCQHPVLAGALGKIAEDTASCTIIAREVGAIQQLILMALSDNEIVVQQACKILGLLGKSELFTSDDIIQGDVLRTMLDLICSLKHKSQLAGLGVLAGLAMTSAETAKRLLSPKLHQALAELVRSGTDDVRISALETVGNLSFQVENRAIFLADADLMEWVIRLARDQVEGLKKRVSMAAIRALATLGENGEVGRAVGRPGPEGRGVRILSMDGGGMKGIAIVRLLKQIELRTQRRIHELFDLVCGTSTGGILAVALALQQMTLEQCEGIYRSLGQKVFSRPGAGAAREEETGWKESLYKFYKSGQQSMRVAVYGCKHDAAMFEDLLKEYCLLDPGQALGNAMIDSASLNVPKCFVVSTLVSMTPANAFIFRNYELSPGSAERARQIKAPPSSASHQIWQAVRASSAAPYYLDDFKCGHDRFQDGAASANNPAALALTEARLLWPDTPISCLVSLGSGAVPLQRREKSMSAYLDIGSVLIESACSVDRIDSALATVLPLVPGLSYYRFCCEDPRCGIELDEIDPEQWALLEAATDEYIAQNEERFLEAADLLLQGIEDPSADAARAPTSLSLGARRKVLVLEASAAAEAVPAGSASIHSVSSAVAGLPFAERLTTDSLINTDSCSSHAPLDLAELVESMSMQDRQIGAVHLAMQPALDSLIFQWSHAVEAVVDPGPQAAALVEAAGLAPEQTLSQLWAEGRHELPAGQHSFIRLLGVQSLLVGPQRMTSVLLLHTTPSLTLRLEQLQLLARAISGCIVTSSACLPEAVIEALLRGGCKALVCCKGDAEEAEEPPQAAAFFSMLYEQLNAGSQLLEALHEAEEAVPCLGREFCCWQIRDGSVQRIERPQQQREVAI